MAESAQPQWLIAIDTSSDWTSVALTDGASTFDYNWNARREQTTTVMVEIDRLLTANRISIGDIGAVAVAIGPGSFSGLRVGLGIAKGFAIATGMSIIGVPTLIATIQSCGSTADCFGVIKAGRSRYVWIDSRFQDTYLNGTIDDLVVAIRASDVSRVVGELEPQDLATLARSGVEIVSGELQRAKSIAAIGWKCWQNGELSDLNTLEPIYVHAPARKS